MKKVSKILTTWLLSLSILTSLAPISTAFAANFSDVSSKHARSKAINFLKDNGIIDGYNDGTFRPNQKVNRVEFLKIVLEASDIELDATEATGFLDVDEKAWYGAYLKKAKKEGWVAGYGDKTFKPGNQINQVEALKIIAEVQKWQLRQNNEITEDPFNDTPKSAWYVAYVDFAKSKGIVENRKTKLFPAKQLTRADVAHLLYLTIEKRVSKFKVNGEITESTNTTTTKITTTPRTESTNTSVSSSSNNKPTAKTESLNFTPTTFKTLSTDSFTGITLNSPIPNTFYKNEVFFIEGRLSSNKDKVLIFLSYNQNGQTKYINKLGDVSSTGSFSVPFTFSQTGNYNIGIIPGSSGSSKVYKVSVLPSLPAQSNVGESLAPTNTKITFEDDQTTISWNKNSNNFFRVNIWQGNKIVSLINRQGKSSIPLNYPNFIEFKEGTVNFDVEAAKASSSGPLKINSSFATSAKASFKATTHLKSDLESSSISVDNFKEILGSKKTITFSGTTKTATYKKAAIIKPNGFVEDITLKSGSPTSDYFGNAILPANAKFTFEYKPSQNGTYVVEINKQNGAASLNSPVYVGNGIPLLPDYFDIASTSPDNSNKSLSANRKELLEYVNKARRAHGLKEVRLSEELNNLAQLHSQDMVDNNYFGHINLQGQSPTDRRKELGIPTIVGENLSRAPSIRFGHEGLMRSAIHRENILNADWDRVGLGIVKDSQGYFYVTQEFSGEPYNSSDLEELEDELFEAINEERQNQGLQKVVKNSTLDKITSTLGQKLLLGGSITSADLTSEFQSNNINKGGFVNNGSSTSNKQIIEQITDVITSSHGQWQEIGINYTTDEFGLLIFVILYTN